MQPDSPILDQPQTIDWEEYPATATYRLANQDLQFEVDANTDLCDLVWPWAGEAYAKRIALTVSAPREDALMPMVTRLYPWPPGVDHGHRRCGSDQTSGSAAPE